MIPTEITAGDSLAWTETESEYPAGDGWVVHYVLVNASSRITFNSVADGDKHSFVIDMATTGAWKAGDYTYQRYVTDGSERITLTNGTVEIKPDFTTASDHRSHAKKVLDAIEAVIENRATLDQESYSIAGRSLTRMNVEELLKFRGYYAAKVRKEKKLSSTVWVRI